MAKIKQLFAIHYDPFGRVVRTKIAEGNTGDFANAAGFQVVDVITHHDASDEVLENGTYPVMLDGEFQNLEGKLKTLADATFTNKDQREAFKSMIAEILWSNFTRNIETVNGMYNSSENNASITYNNPKVKINK